jgi:chromate transporter
MMTWDVWLSLFGHFIVLSLLAIGGAITTAPDMQRYVVQEQGWLSGEQFTSCIAIAQAAPGPNVLFIPLIGWQIGLQAGGTYFAATAGMLATFIGIMVPSSTLTFAATQRGSRHGARQQSIACTDLNCVAARHGLAAHRRQQPTR